MAKAEALLGAGQAWVHEQLDAVWRVANDNAVVPDDLHAQVRLACSWSVQNSINAIQHLVDAEQLSKLREIWPHGSLDDARAVAGHFMVGSYQIDTAGRVLLGLEAGDPAFYALRSTTWQVQSSRTAMPFRSSDEAGKRSNTSGS